MRGRKKTIQDVQAAVHDLETIKKLEKQLRGAANEIDDLKRQVKQVEYLENVIKERNAKISEHNKTIERLKNQRAALVNYVTWSELFP